MINNDQKIRIVISDDHTLFRNGLVKLLGDAPNLHFVGETANGRELVESYFEAKPDIIITDISMPVLGGLDAIAAIKKEDPAVKALVLSIHSGEEYIYYTYKAGGLGLLCKSVSQEELCLAIMKIYDGEYYFGKDITGNKLQEIIHKYEEIDPGIKRRDEFLLTTREKEVLVLIGEAMTSNEIAKKLNVSRRTIDTHRANLIQKLGLKSLPELIAYAVRFSPSSRADTV